MKAGLAQLSWRLAGRSGVLVDSNILIDIATNDQKWAVWSGQALAECAEHAALVINPIIYAEVSIGFQSIEALNAALPSQLYQRSQLPWEAGFLAGKCFKDYRRRGGARTTPLPDLYIGAHAAIMKLALLTRDNARYRTYFVAPEYPTKHHKNQQYRSHFWGIIFTEFVENIAITGKKRCSPKANRSSLSASCF